VLYKRILLKLSGEFFGNSNQLGLNATRLQTIAQQLDQLVSHQVQVGIVIGGGNLVRGYQLAENQINRVIADQMGMLATAINGLALRDALEQKNIPTRLVSALLISGMLERHNPRDVNRYLREGDIVILCGGTGNPFFTTDTAACLRAIEINADIMFKATKVDGIYDKDPMKNKEARKYDKLTYDQAIGLNLEVMDLTAITLARDHKMPIRVFDMLSTGLMDMMQDKKLGTLISN